MASLFEVLVPSVGLGLLAHGADAPLAAVAVLAAVAGAALGWRFQRRKIAEETRRTVMASVMDAQNNLLNSMIYFQLKAEKDRGLSDGDLRCLEHAIRTASSRLNEIAETDLDEIRDLGGIRVLRPRAA